MSKELAPAPVDPAEVKYRELKLTLRVTDEQIELLDVCATARDTTRSDVVRQIGVIPGAAEGKRILDLALRRAETETKTEVEDVPSA